MAGRAFAQSEWDGGNYELLRPDARRALALLRRKTSGRGIVRTQPPSTS